jgi:hypothetical protein
MTAPVVTVTAEGYQVVVRGPPAVLHCGVVVKVGRIARRPNRVVLRPRVATVKLSSAVVTAILLALQRPVLLTLSELVLAAAVPADAPRPQMFRATPGTLFLVHVGGGGQNDLIWAVPVEPRAGS